jgi:hypothetical protein
MPVGALLMSRGEAASERRESRAFCLAFWGEGIGIGAVRPS